MRGYQRAHSIRFLWCNRSRRPDILKKERGSLVVKQLHEFPMSSSWWSKPLTSLCEQVRSWGKEKMEQNLELKSIPRKFESLTIIRSKPYPIMRAIKTYFHFESWKYPGIVSIWFGMDANFTTHKVQQSTTTALAIWGG